MPTAERSFFASSPSAARRGFAERKRRSRLAHERRRVGHDTNDPRAGGQRRFQPGERHASGDGNQQMAVRKTIALLGQHAGDLVGFHGQNQDAGEFQNVGVRRGGFRAGFRGESGAGRGRHVAGDDFPGEDNFRADEAARQGGGHFARAEKADGEFGCHGNCLAGRFVRRKRKRAGKFAVNSRLEFAPVESIVNGVAGFPMNSALN